MNNTTNSTVYISNLSYQRDRNGLKSMFSQFGRIKNIKIVVEPKTNQSRGMAFIEMTTSEEAKMAIETLNNQIVDGRTIKASWAIPQRGVAPTKVEKKAVEKDLDYVATQLAKKARNEAKRKSNPYTFKLKSK